MGMPIRKKTVAAAYTYRYSGPVWVDDIDPVWIRWPRKGHHSASGPSWMVIVSYNNDSAFGPSWITVSYSEYSAFGPSWIIVPVSTSKVYADMKHKIK